MPSAVLLATILLFCASLVRADETPAKCGQGYFSPTGREPCCQCCAGFFSTSSGSTSCTQCPASFPYSDPGSTSPFSCGRGTGYTSTCAVSNHVCPATTPAPNPTRGPHRRSPPRRKWCPKGFKNCPVYGSSGKLGFLKAYECVDILNDLESCGGCVDEDTLPGTHAEDGGRDCSGIPHVDAVACTSGRCIIESCARGFNVSADGEDCLPSGSNGISLQFLDYE